MTDLDDRAIGVERRPGTGEPQVELVVIRRHGQDVELVLEDGETLLFDARELRFVLNEDVAA
jgi:hypothetical protein